MLKVSLIAGVYNKEKYIEKCVKSMLAQTYENIEIILFNNASTDHSQEIIDRLANLYPDKIKAYKTDVNLGAGGGRTKGMEYAAGDYICFIDSDDYVAPDYIQQCITGVEDSDVLPDIIISGFTKVDNEGNVLYKRKYKNEASALYQSIAPWGKLFKREYITKHNLSLWNIPFAEDVIFAAELVMTEPFVKMCNADGYLWIEHIESTSHVAFRGFPKYALEKAFEYFAYIKKKYSNKSGLLDYFAFKYVAWYLLHSGRNTGSVKMLEQYNKALMYLKQEFPNYKKCSYISPFKPKEERQVVRFVIWSIHIMQNMKIDRIFFSIYSKLNVDKLWPQL
jgi:glycosyltransferase involved in cell wall biosynthesis